MKAKPPLPQLSAGKSLFHDRFAAFVEDTAFPCLGAKAAFNAGSYQLSIYPKLASSKTSQLLAKDLERFVRSEISRDNPYATFIAIFRQPLEQTEIDFERSLWLQLQSLNQIDRRSHTWDPSVSPDPAAPFFSFSFAGKALYVIGLHRKSSRKSRQFQWPALVFNPHEQFERLRSEGKWQRMRDSIRARDRDLQGDINPMLSDFGENSEARQYSGRAVEANWRPPFRAVQAKAGRCPFAH
jgi:FPC/CPF motif-containing protein YcgG